MKQEIAVKKFIDEYPDQSQIVAYRRANRLYLQNLSWAEGKVEIRLDEKTSKMIIEISMNEDEYLVFGQTDGFAVKKTLEGK